MNEIESMMKDQIPEFEGSGVFFVNFSSKYCLILRAILKKFCIS